MSSRIKTANRVYTSIEVEVAHGLEDVTANEIIASIDTNQIKNLTVLPGAVQFDFSGNLAELRDLQTTVAAYILLKFDVPRPKALLGHQHFQRLLHSIQTVFSLSDRSDYYSLYLSAAGANSSVMMRLKHELAAHLGLAVGETTGDLWIRVRAVKTTWETLVRITPRPSVTRMWRVCNMEGALNAGVANAMLRLVVPQPNETMLNIMCGTGTFIIEREQINPGAINIGCDINPEALTCADRNIQAAHLADNFTLLLADAASLPFAKGSMDIICADLPFGQLMGSHKKNQILYPHFLNEAWRLGHSGTRFVFITHEVRLMESLLTNNRNWKILQLRKITLRGLHPRVYILQKL